MLCDRKSLCREKPARLERSSCLPQLEKAPVQQEDQHSQNINSNILKQKKQKDRAVEMAPESVWRPWNVVCSGEDERTLDRRPLNLRFTGTWV